ncbi:MAG: response regulator [Treponema sp.]|jgi:DNA-binding response OmpR family regulator|nr:response regulator [Treponema sp.]
MDTRKKILIVDDELTNLEFFEVMLSKLGFVVEEANDGIEALEKVRKFTPDLILLDNIMPKMSGWEVTKTLKADPKFSSIPIVMFSAMDDVKDKVAGLELGVDDYITKPFNFSEVLARIRAVLRNRELFAQIAVRESRLVMAEELNQDMKKNLADFVKSIDELDSTITMVSKSGETQKDGLIDQKALSDLVGAITEKTQAVRKHIAELDARIEKTTVEWEDLKKSEIGLSTLETQIRKFLHAADGRDL